MCLSKLQVKALDKSSQSDFTDIIVAAFESAPLFQKLFCNKSNNPHWHRQATAFAAFLFHKALLSGDSIKGVWIEGELAGVGILERGAGFSIPRFIQQMALLPHFLRLVWILPLNTGRFLNKYIVKTRQCLPDASCHYLTIIGVHPTHQGDGVGKYILQTFIDTVSSDNTSAGIGLDTENAGNIDLYRHLGFELNESLMIAELPVYCLFKANTKICRNI